MYQPRLGCHKNELDTPVLCVDLAAMEANIAFMAGFCRQHKVGWRPHSKCHKSSQIARKLMDAGALGATCAKLGEAEVLARGGVRDLLIANLVVGPAKIERLVKLTEVADPIVCIDHVSHALPISEAMARAGRKVRVVIEIDIGMNRVGVQPGEPVTALAQQIRTLPGIRLVGVMGYEGHLLLLENAAEKTSKIRQSLNHLVQARDQLQGMGIECSIVSCGGTGSYQQSVPHPGITEVQAGGLIFMDAFYRNRCHVSDFQYSMTLLSTVVGRPAPDRAIIDAGRKSMNLELHLPLVLGHDDIRVKALSAEHGILELDPSAQGLRIGDRLEFILGYSDFTTVLHDAMYGIRGERLELIWPLEGRGRLQ